LARHGKRIKPDQLAPKIEEGFTEGPLTPEQARREFPVRRAPGPSYAHMSAPRKRGEPYVAMVLEPNGVPISEPNTGRRFQDVDVIVTEEEAAEMKAGYRCLRCKEPFEEAYPASCSVCGYEVRDRQGLDAPLELDGRRHVGPSRPLGEIMDELELRQELAAFEQKILEGGSRGHSH
jgi:hypothetical protein